MYIKSGEDFTPPLHCYYEQIQDYANQLAAASVSPAPLSSA